MNKILLAAAFLLTISTSPAFSADKAKGGKMAMHEMTKEQREAMAASHEKMAACLRSDKPMGDCHKEMMESCKSMGKNGCPMMGKMEHMHGMKGMDHEHGKMEEDESQEDEKK